MLNIWAQKLSGSNQSVGGDRFGARVPTYQDSYFDLRYSNSCQTVPLAIHFPLKFEINIHRTNNKGACICLVTYWLVFIYNFSEAKMLFLQQNNHAAKCCPIHSGNHSHY